MVQRVAMMLWIAVGASACTPFVPIQKTDTLASDTLHAATEMRVLTADDAKSMQAVGPVTGYACKLMVWDPPATEAAAMLQLKLAAAQRGASALTAVQCKEGGFSLGKNCWQSFTCTGTALK